MNAPHKKRVFVSFSDTNRELAQKLVHQLRERSLDAVSRDDIDQKDGVGARIDELVGSSDGVIFLLGSRDDPHSPQGREWTAALGATFDDNHKHMVPVVLGKRKMPSFLLGYQHLKLNGHRDGLGQAADKIVDIFEHQPRPRRPPTAKEKADYRERIQNLKKMAELMRDEAEKSGL